MKSTILLIIVSLVTVMFTGCATQSDVDELRIQLAAAESKANSNQRELDSQRAEIRALKNSVKGKPLVEILDYLRQAKNDSRRISEIKRDVNNTHNGIIEADRRIQVLLNNLSNEDIVKILEYNFDELARKANEAYSSAIAAGNSAQAAQHEATKAWQEASKVHDLEIYINHLRRHHTKGIRWAIDNLRDDLRALRRRINEVERDQGRNNRNSHNDDDDDDDQGRNRNNRRNR